MHIMPFSSFFYTFHLFFFFYFSFFFFNDTATTEIYTLSLHDALPIPGSSATTTMSAGPPSGFGPVRATAQARTPVRSSPAPAKPATSQPSGSGQGSQTGTPTVPGLYMCSSPSRPSWDGLNAGSSGCTSPCQSQRQALDHAVGCLRGRPHRGQAAGACRCLSWPTPVPICDGRCSPGAVLPGSPAEHADAGSPPRGESRRRCVLQDP